MSLILEALRKSEAERRRAVVPDLLAEPAVAAPVATTTPQRWPWIAGGLAIAVLLTWYAMRDRGTAPITVVPVSDTRVAEQPVQAPTTPAGPQRTAPALRRPLVVAPAPVAPPAAPKPDPVTDIPALPPPPRVEAKPAPPVAIDMTERVSDLGNDERKQLPPLKLSMHMWNDVAAQRFVIIDGTRLRVGDRLGAVVIADIQPDGVLLDWNGRALKLPLR